MIIFPKKIEMINNLPIVVKSCYDVFFEEEYTEEKFSDGYTDHCTTDSDDDGCVYKIKKYKYIKKKKNGLNYNPISKSDFKKNNNFLRKFEKRNEKDLEEKIIDKNKNIIRNDFLKCLKYLFDKRREELKNKNKKTQNSIQLNQDFIMTFDHLNSLYNENKFLNIIQKKEIRYY